jgi:hypothetical protein
MNIVNYSELPPPIYCSGRKGLAGDDVVQSVLIQFPDDNVPTVIVPDVPDQAKIDEIISI